MDWKEAEHRLLRRLYREVRVHRGHIREIERRLERSEGYLSRLYRGRKDFKLRLFLQTIDEVGLEQGSFFSSALGYQPTPEDHLREVEDPYDPDPEFRRMAQATRELEIDEPPAYPAASATAADVAEIAVCSRHEQLRRLHATQKYRTHAFAGAYLKYLDSLRYDDAKLASRLATRVAVRLIPDLPGPQRDRLALQCLALGVFGSARRLKGRFGAAARPLRLALELSKRAGLREDRANLLLRACYVLRDFGQFHRALALVEKAFTIFGQLGSRWDMGRALLDYGMLHWNLGEYEEAVLDLERALEFLAGSEAQLSRHNLSAYQYLGLAYERLGKLTKAQECLERGAKTFPPEHAVHAARLQWVGANLAFRHGEYERAEELLKIASDVLIDKEFPGREALLTLDRIHVMIAQGKTEEATVLALGTAPLLLQFQNNPIAEASIFELMTIATEGRLDEAMVCEIRAKLDGERTPQGGTLVRR